MEKASTIDKGQERLPEQMFAEDLGTRRVHRRLGLANGLLIGLALAIGSWALQAAALARLPVPLKYPSLLLSSILLLIITGLTGWLSSRFDKIGLTLLFWLAAAVLSSLVIGYEPYYVRTLMVWLAAPRFRGLLIYPIATGATPATIAVAGFLIILMLVVLAILQSYRLEAIRRESSGGGRLALIPWLSLLLPVPFVAGAGLVTQEFLGDASAQAIQLVHQAIPVSRSYEGDLFELGLRDNLNYSALQGVRELMSANYSLIVGDINPVMSTTFVVAHFDNGAWINCRVVNGQLSFCYDASPPYMAGLVSLLTGQEVPEDCRGCLPRVDDEWLSWFESQHRLFTGTPRLTRVAQWGEHVLMRAETAEGDYGVECWFEGISPVRLTQCTAEPG